MIYDGVIFGHPEAIVAAIKGSLSTPNDQKINVQFTQVPGGLEFQNQPDLLIDLIGRAGLKNRTAYVGSERKNR